MIDIPTPLEPVNVSPPSRLSPTSAAPAWSPAPVTRLTTPGGTPPSTNASYIRCPHNEPISDGLMTTVLPATSAAPAGPATSAAG